MLQINVCFNLMVKDTSY
uniref:Uncharacterized protein n=1 Tax=Rhizophora mucronata TaxID=61149 RepID=A0A2P2MVP0_RHIMU